MRMMLKDTCQFYSGTGFPEIYQGIDSGKYPFYKVGDISANVTAGHVYLQQCGNYISDDIADTIHGTIIPPDTVVFAKIGEALKKNRRALTQCNCLIDNNAMGIAPRNEMLRTKYFYYFMCKLEMQKYAEATAVPSVRKSKLEQVYIDVPSLNDQENIEQKLDAITAIIKARQCQLCALDTLIKARFIEMFGDLADPASKWPTCRLIEACDESDDIKCGPFGTQLSKDEYQESGIPVWEIPQINSAFAIAPEHFLTVEKATQLQAYSLSFGDIVMSRKGNVGKCAVFPADKPNGILHSDVLRIRVSPKKSNSCFMMYQLHFSRDIIRQIEMVSSGAIMAGVNVTKLKDIIVKMPPLDLQNQFATFVSQINKSKVVVQKTLDEAQLLFDGLMQQYFG